MRIALAQVDDVSLPADEKRPSARAADVAVVVGCAEQGRLHTSNSEGGDA